MGAQEETFGRYVLLSRLGYGGMAEVFLARTEGFGGFAKRLAIKRLLPCYSQDQQTVDLLADEAKITVRLAHPNIVQVYDFGRVGDSYFIAMEYIDGLDLKSVVELDEFTSEPMPVDLALYVTQCVLAALDYAHNRADEYGNPLHIIHRDVSPQNVLISRHGEVKLTDFGVARAAISCHVSVIGDIRGKFSYMPPEQATGGEIDQRIDLFAAGAILYELLTGKQPYRSVSSGQQIVQLFQDVAPPSQLNPALPPAVDGLVLKALARERDDRFATAHEFGAAVGAVLDRRSDPIGLQRQLARLVEGRLDEEPHGVDGAERSALQRETSAAETRLGFRGRQQPLHGVVSGEIGDGHGAPGPIVSRSTEIEELDDVFLEEDSLDGLQTASFPVPRRALGLAPTALQEPFPPPPASFDDSSDAIPTIIAGPEVRRGFAEAERAAPPPDSAWAAARYERADPAVQERGRRAPTEYLTPPQAAEPAPDPHRRMATEYLTPAGAEPAAAPPPRRAPAGPAPRPAASASRPSRSAGEVLDRPGGRVPTEYLTPPGEGPLGHSDPEGLHVLRRPPAEGFSPSGRWAAMSGHLRESPLTLYLTIAGVVLVLGAALVLAIWVARAD